MPVGKKVEDTKKIRCNHSKTSHKNSKKHKKCKTDMEKKKSAKGYVIYAKAGKGKYKK